MDNHTRRFWDEEKKKKAVDDPKVRWKDPACWKCLSDEQRDVIHEWYIDRILEEKEEKEKHQGRLEYAGFFGLIPFAVAYGFHASKSVWGMVLNALCAWAVYMFIFFLFSKNNNCSRYACPIEKILR